MRCVKKEIITYMKLGLNMDYQIMFQGYPDMLTVKEVKEALRIGLNQTYALIHSNAIRHVKIGKDFRIPKCSLLDYSLGKDYNCNVNGGFNLRSEKETIAQ